MELYRNYEWQADGVVTWFRTFEPNHNPVIDHHVEGVCCWETVYSSNDKLWKSLVEKLVSIHDVSISITIRSWQDLLLLLKSQFQIVRPTGVLLNKKLRKRYLMQSILYRIRIVGFPLRDFGQFFTSGKNTWWSNYATNIRNNGRQCR